MAIPDQVYLLCRALKEKATEEAAKILADAREQAEQIRKDAREEIQRRLGHWASRERMAAYKEARQITDAAELKARQTVMAAKERLVAEIQNAVKERLIELRSSGEYPDILKRIARKALRALPGEEALLQVRSDDSHLITEDFLQDLAKSTGKRVKLMKEPADISGGCVAYSANQKMLVDFSFEAFLEREYPRLKGLLAKEILEVDTRDRPPSASSP